MFNKKKKILITTAIDYTNDVIHIGHAYEKILADSIARYCRLLKGDENVYFLTGTDEHGTTNEKAAAQHGVAVEDYVTEVSKKDKEQIDSLNISYNRFIRTTDADHVMVVKEFFKKAVQTGDVYKHVYKGFYCESCESHKTLSELNESGQCPLHPTKQIQELEEENYFFKWSKYAPFLKDLISNNPDFVLPEGKQKEMLSFLEGGLTDIPVSRPKYKVSWGIEIPTDNKQVVYVWYDALTNYYTAGLIKGFWNDDTQIIHFVGKDILRFHSLLWPAMLENAGYKLPDTVYAHGFINLNGEKISKSRGNVIRPTELIEKYGTDAVRYYLLRHGPNVEDVNISLDHLKESYNADLANGLGNTVARLAKLAQTSELSFKQFKPSKDFYDDTVFAPLNSFRVDLTLQNIWAKLGDLDKHINENEPWKITDKSKLQEVLDFELTELAKIAYMVEPFLPETSSKIQNLLSEENIKVLDKPLFPRIL